MKRFPIAAALLLVASAAHAGSIEIKITTAAAGTSTVTTRIPDAQIARLIAFYGASVDVDTGTVDAGGVPIMRAATRDESITRWVADIFTHAKNVVQSYEQREAAKVVAPLNLGVVGTP